MFLDHENLITAFHMNGWVQIQEVVISADFQCVECQKRIADIISRMNGEFCLSPFKEVFWFNSHGYLRKHFLRDFRGVTTEERGVGEKSCQQIL